MMRLGITPDCYVIKAYPRTRSHPEEWVVWSALMKSGWVSAHIAIVAICPTEEAAQAALRLLNL